MDPLELLKQNLHTLDHKFRLEGKKGTLVTMLDVLPEDASRLQTEVVNEILKSYSGAKFDSIKYDSENNQVQVIFNPGEQTLTPSQEPVRTASSGGCSYGIGSYKGNNF